jgi:hypothetical protein
VASEPANPAHGEGCRLVVRSLIKHGQVGSGRAVRSFGEDRTCAVLGCDTKLSRYNPDPYCWVHADRSLPSAAKRTRE